MKQQSYKFENNLKLKYQELNKHERAVLHKVGRKNCDFLTRSICWKDCGTDRCRVHEFNPYYVYRVSSPLRFPLAEPSTLNQHVSLPDRVVFSGPATIAFWPHDIKVMVKVSGDDVFDLVIGYLRTYYIYNTGMSHTQANKQLNGVIQMSSNNLCEAGGVLRGFLLSYFMTHTGMNALQAKQHLIGIQQ